MKQTMSGLATVEPCPTVTFFNRRAADYDREYDAPTTAGYALRVRREKVLAMLGQYGGGNVLDVGCGPGPMALPLVERNCRFWGVDPSESMLQICRARFASQPHMKFVLGNATQLDFPDGFFDVVLCMGVLDAVPDATPAVREMLRALKPGGILLVTFTNILSPYSWWKRYVFYRSVSWYRRIRRGRGCRAVPPPDATKRSLYTKRGAIDLLKAGGARVAQIQGYYYNPFLSPLDEWFPALALRTVKNLEWHRGSASEWMAAGWIMKAQKISGGPDANEFNLNGDYSCSSSR